MRYDLYTKIKDENDIEIFDVLSIDWNTFEFINGSITHTITKPEAERVDMITYPYYNTVDFEDAIFSINKIANTLDFLVGLKIKIPILTDLREFIKKNKGV